MSEQEHKERPVLSKYARKVQSGQMMYGGCISDSLNYKPETILAIPEHAHHHIGVVVDVGKKGFGFIRTDEGRGPRLYFHANDCKNSFESLTPGQKVMYTIRRGRRGLNAQNVTRY